MKKVFLFCGLYICHLAPIVAQKTFITFQAKWDSGGGIAAYCWGHETTNKQVNCADPLDRRTWAHLNLASRDFVDGNNAHYGAKMIASNGFLRFSASLLRNGFNWSDVTIRFSGSSLMQDVEGVDYFYSGTSETRFYKGGRYHIFVRNVEIANGFMPDLQDIINYNDRLSCQDDIIRLQSSFTIAPTPIAGNLLGLDFVKDIGNKGIGFVFPALGRTAIRNDFVTKDCNPLQRTGAYFECAEGQIVLSDYPYNAVNAPIGTNNNGGCIQLVNAVRSNNAGNWLNFMYNGTIIASLLDNANMGQVQVAFKTIVNQPVHMSIAGNYWLDRDFTFVPERQPNQPVRLRLYFTSAEWNRLINASNADNRQFNDPQSLLDLLVTRVCKPNMCMDLMANDIGTFIKVVEAGSFNRNGYYVDIFTNYLSNFTISYNRILDAGNNQVQNIVLPNFNPLINCTIGAQQQLFSATPNGMWSSSDVAIANFVNNNGTIRANSNGSTIITYAVPIANTNNCKAETFATYVVAQQTSPVIAAASNVSCSFGGNTVVNTNMPGGRWNSDNVAVASINAATPLTANILSRANGNTNITYTVTNAQGCRGISNNIVFTVAPVPALPAIIGVNAICANRNAILSNPIAGGQWSSDKPANAVVNNNGLVSGVAAGNNVNITYTVRNNAGCSASTTKRINVLAVPATPIVQPIVPTNLLAICSQNSIVLKAVPEGGVWTSTGTATVSPLGILSFKNQTVGAGTVTYTTPANANGCTNAFTMNVNSIACGNMPVVFDNSQNRISISFNNHINVYPNPVKTNEYIHVKLGETPERYVLTLRDLSGKIVLQSLSNGNDMRLSTKGLTKGVYVLSIIHSQETIIKKILIEE